jgi:hypothetical protein
MCQFQRGAEGLGQDLTAAEAAHVRQNCWISFADNHEQAKTTVAVTTAPASVPAMTARRDADGVGFDVVLAATLFVVSSGLLIRRRARLKLDRL